MLFGTKLFWYILGNKTHQNMALYWHLASRNGHSEWSFHLMISTLGIWFPCSHLLHFVSGASSLACPNLQWIRIERAARSTTNVHAKTLAVEQPFPELLEYPFSSMKALTISCKTHQNTDRRKFRSQTSDNMDRWKSRGGKSQRGEEKKWRSEKRKRAKKEDAGARKVGKSRFTVFFSISNDFVALGGRKVGSLKRRVRSRLGAKHMSKSKCTKHARFGPLLEVEMSKKCTPLWREAHFQVKMHKAHHSQTTFGRWDVEKVHAVVARSTFPSQNVQNTPFSDHCWKLRCRKSARRCGAKHISKSKCEKHHMLGPLSDVQMEKVYADVVWSTFGSQKCQKLVVLSLFWRSDVQKVTD